MAGKGHRGDLLEKVHGEHFIQIWGLRCDRIPIQRLWPWPCFPLSLSAVRVWSTFWCQVVPCQMFGTVTENVLEWVSMVHVHVCAVDTFITSSVRVVCWGATRWQCCSTQASPAISPIISHLLKWHFQLVLALKRVIYFLVWYLFKCYQINPSQPQLSKTSPFPSPRLQKFSWITLN